MQDRCNSIVNALELRLSYTNPLICTYSLAASHARSWIGTMPTAKGVMIIMKNEIFCWKLHGLSPYMFHNITQSSSAVVFYAYTSLGSCGKRQLYTLGKFHFLVMGNPKRGFMIIASIMICDEMIHNMLILLFFVVANLSLYTKQSWHIR